MEYLNNAQALIDDFSELFPIEVNHSGGHHICNDFKELEEWDGAAGELWANFLDSKGFSADFDLDDLERQGDDLILEYYVEQNLDSFINGNISSSISNFNELFNECLFDDVMEHLNAQECQKNTDLIILKLLESKY